MKKIVYLDFVYPKSHLRLDVNQINCLSNIGDVYVLSPKGRYRNFPSNVHLTEKKSIIPKRGKFATRICSLWTMLISASFCHRLKPDYVFVSSYETIVFALGRVLFGGRYKIVLLHHMNIDELTSRVKRFFFKSYMNKVEHVVFLAPIKEYLVETFGIRAEQIHVLPHHNLRNSSVHSSVESKKKYTCVGLSNSNDEKMIEDIINLEKISGRFKENNCRVILKSKVIEFDDGYLKVIRGFLENDVFQEYLSNTQCVYIPFSPTYRYRMSGTLIDAFSNDKIVCGSDILCIEEYSKRYPSICDIITDAGQFCEFVSSMKVTLGANQKKSFEDFKRDHSTEKIVRIMGEIFQ